jgi:3-oxoacyl-[acyl-carrier protein] reductase
VLLSSKVAIITGGVSGIGRACVERFLAEGAHVIIADLNAEKGEVVAQELASRGNVVFTRTDIADRASAQNCVDRAVETFGRLDLLVNNAARLIRPEQNALSAMENARAYFEVNAFGAFNMIEAAAPEMAKNRWGRIVNVASESAYLLSGSGVEAPGADKAPSIAGAGFAAQLAVYGWSKHAVIYLTKFAAINLGPWGINVNCVCPGSTGTEAYFRTLTEDDLQASAAKLPIKIAGQPRHQAGVVAFLCGEDAALMTGQVLLVDGGGKMPA